MKRVLSLILALVICLSLFACAEKHVHEWDDATCTTPKTCKSCGKTEGLEIGHDWEVATCTNPKTCKTCNATEGAANGHDWKAATCTNPKICKTCNATEGAANGHDWKAATCTEPKTCKTCKATEGNKKGHSWAAATCTKPKTCRNCNATEGAAKGHSWAAATCTKAKTCKTCNATQGSANGHNWAAATCTKAKTCKTCNATEGSVKGHTPNSSGKCSTCGTKLTAKDFAYLAGTDFRAIKRDYSNAEGQAAYVILFTDENGDLCVLTYIRFKIISNYSQTTLHNLSTGKTIKNPYDYYDNLADRSYGATKIHYMGLANEVYGKEILAMRGISDMLSTGSHSGVGAYVDAATLNL